MVDPLGFNGADAKLWQQESQAAHSQNGGPALSERDFNEDMLMSENAAAYAADYQAAYAADYQAATGETLVLYNGGPDPRPGHGNINDPSLPSLPGPAPSDPADGHAAACPSGWLGGLAEEQDQGDGVDLAEGKVPDFLLDELAEKAEMGSFGSVFGTETTLADGLDVGIRGTYVFGGYANRLRDILNGYDPAIGDPTYNAWRRR